MPEWEVDFASQLKIALGPFGGRVMQEVVKVAQTQDRLSHACRELGIPYTADAKDLIHSLTSYIQECGQEDFLSQWSRYRRKNRLGQSAYKPSDTKVRKVSDDELQWLEPAETRGLSDTAVRRRRRTVSNLSDTATWARPRSVGRAGLNGSSDGIWSGVERRNGQERRNGIDRRANIDLVFKNRRYGGDRRSGVDRRRGSQ